MLCLCWMIHIDLGLRIIMFSIRGSIPKWKFEASSRSSSRGTT